MRMPQILTEEKNQQGPGRKILTGTARTRKLVPLENLLGSTSAQVEKNFINSKTFIISICYMIKIHHFIFFCLFFAIHLSSCKYFWLFLDVLETHLSSNLILLLVHNLQIIVLNYAQQIKLSSSALIDQVSIFQCLLLFNSKFIDFLIIQVSHLALFKNSKFFYFLYMIKSSISLQAIFKFYIILLVFYYQGFISIQLHLHQNPFRYCSLYRFGIYGSFVYLLYQQEYFFKYYLLQFLNKLLLISLSIEPKLMFYPRFQPVKLFLNYIFIKVIVAYSIFYIFSAYFIWAISVTYDAFITKAAQATLAEVRYKAFLFMLVLLTINF